ncbi:MAG: tetratricopeptide repeat protein [Muribaculaceae bacterium]|nr:tetratricopeptide repeat protein [Muribaculaceae bacterium]
MNRNEEIKRLIDAGDINGALALFDGAASMNADDYFMRGKLYWRLGKRREAINDYHASVALDPDGPAAKALQQANAVMAFFNLDLLNP